VSEAFEPGCQSDGCNIICPYCGNKTQADSCDGDASEDTSTRECDECGKEFVLYASISVTYHTAQKGAE